MSGHFARLAVLAGAFLLAGCVTSDPYAQAYDSCDREAGACYADCRALDDERRRAACQDRCTTGVNRCFADVRDRAERFSSYRVSPDYVFYGRYGAWHPYDGYRYGRHGRRYSYGGYAYDRWGYDRWGYDRYGYDRYGYDYFGRRRPRGAVIGPGAITRNGTASTPATRPTAPSEPDDGRYQTEDGSVFTEDGRRLRYGGITEPRDRPRTNGVRPTGRTSDPTVKPSRPSRPVGKPQAPRTQPAAKPTRPRASPPSKPQRPETAPRRNPRARDGKTQVR